MQTVVHPAGHVVLHHMGVLYEGRVKQAIQYPEVDCHQLEGKKLTVAQQSVKNITAIGAGCKLFNVCRCFETCERTVESRCS